LRRTGSYEAICVRLKKGCEDDGHIYFVHRPLVGSRRRHSSTLKRDFDVTSSGANERPVNKMDKIELFELCQICPDLLENKANGVICH
ncbi:hypothetical protein PENTCL1PPCAC_3281, partial [Pristionchus entomophagus]